MDPSKIELTDMNKMLIYEQQSRTIDKLDLDQARNFAKSYFKLYLKQQEVVSDLCKKYD